MTKDQILEQLKIGSHSQAGDYRAVADDRNPGTFKVELRKDGKWILWEDDLDMEDAAELLYVFSVQGGRP